MKIIEPDAQQQQLATLQITLPHYQKALLQAAAAEAGVTVSEFVTHALMLFIDVATLRKVDQRDSPH